MDRDPKTRGHDRASLLSMIPSSILSYQGKAVSPAHRERVPSATADGR